MPYKMMTEATMSLTLKLVNDIFAIHSLEANSKIPEQVFDASIYFIAKTHEEVSIVAPQSIEIPSDDVEKDWQALEVVGPLDFSLTGLLSRISSVLANEKISIFAISTFDTDYILVKTNTLEAAIAALKTNNYKII